MHGEMTLGIADPMPDMAFARGMLPHHIGAVDMAKIELEYGTDEEMRQLAQHIIDTQQVDIELMQNWIVALKATSDVENDNAEVGEPNGDTTANEKSASEDPDTKTKEE